MALNNSGETVERLAPKPTVLRALYLLSGNRCAYPGCLQVMVDAEGDFVGEVCHIEAAEAGGQRFNPDRTNEQNRGISNLMLMCANHHRKTNNVDLFSVARLAEIKRDHEAKFVDIGEKIASSVVDSTDSNVSIQAKNLNRLNRVLGYELDSSTLGDMVRALGKHAAFLELVPQATRSFLGAIAARIYKMRDFGVVYENMGSYKISVTDIEQALSLSPRDIQEKCRSLEHYALGALDETGDYEMPWAITLRNLEDWPVWLDLAAFAKAEGVPLSTFWKDLDFSSLDE